MPSSNGPDRQVAKRVSKQVRIYRVLRLKMMGATDRDIQAQLAADPEEPVNISHTQVNRDWHLALEEVTKDNLKKAESLRTLMGLRLERLLMTQWPAATRPGAPVGVVDLCRRLIKDQTELYGLARELGDEDRPINIQDAKVDYDGLSDDEVAQFLEVAERLEAASLGLGPDGTGPVESGQPAA